jgi:hypothetical protein
MKNGCEGIVQRTLKDARRAQFYAMTMKFSWEAYPEYQDTATAEWIKQRKLAHRDFLTSFESWGETYKRKTRCHWRREEMAIAEYGVLVLGG